MVCCGDDHFVFGVDGADNFRIVTFDAYSFFDGIDFGDGCDDRCCCRHRVYGSRKKK